MKRSIMTLSFGVLLGSAVVLAGGMFLTHRAGDPPTADPMNARVPQLAPGATIPDLRASSDEEPGASSAGAGSDQMAQRHQQEMAALSKELAFLRREISAVQRQRHEQRRAATVGAPESAADPAPDPHTAPAARAAAERAWQQRMAMREATFRHEPTDPPWAAEAAGAVQAALASDDRVQNLLLGLDCRSHTCRVELAEDDTGELAKALPLLLLQLAPTLPHGTANYVDASDGGRAMILYLSREAPEPPPTGK